MKKVLVIAYYWPPSGGAGVQRWLKFVKYLRDFHWEPVVFCPENPEYPETDLSLMKDIPLDLEVVTYPIWEPYNAYKKLLGQKKDVKINAGFLTETTKNKTLEKFSVWIRGNLFIPDARKFWIKPSVRYLKKYLAQHPVDVIVSTGPPHSAHLIAMQVARSLKLPWLADFRDPWTNIDFYKDLRLTKFADHKHHQLELKVLQQASAVSVISASMSDDFKRIHNRSFEVITNGYDLDDLSPGVSSIRDRKFSIAHIGTLVNTRNPLSLWKSLKWMVENNPNFSEDIEIKLVGKVDILVTKSIEEFGLTRFVKKIPYLPHDQVVICQQESQVLLLIINNTPNAKMILTGKFFEYLAAGRPILCVGPDDGDAAAILSETRSGLLAGFDDVETMKNHLLSFYRDYKSGNLIAKNENIGKYSRKELTRALAEVLNKIS
ncbi:MAG: glycosyl transferase family 1 [Bacteroidota bacterium]